MRISKLSYFKSRHAIMLFKLTLLFLFLIIGVFADERPIVKTRNGLVRGIYKNSANGKQFTAFEGIPYAEPPLNELRFKAPVPKKPWTGIWDANTIYACIQLDHSPRMIDPVHGNEDCLYVNVYSPRINDETASMDVIVHFHGGAFMFGEGSLYGPNLLMDRDVVYVNLNYRLGPLGFLATEDEVSPGNYGLKDQSLALKWIKDNIAAFGGNPESVTITGMSAGGASVHFHYLTPLSKDLFVRGISMSGTSLSNWALVEKPLEKARQLGTVVGCGQANTKDLVACLRQRSAKQLAAASKKLQPWLYNPYSPFGPVVEPNLEGAFVSEQPYEIIRSGQVADVPWITSITKEEGLYPCSEFISSDEYLPFLEKNWEKLAAYILHFDGTVQKESWSEVAQKIRENYFGNRLISTETFSELVAAVGDRLFKYEAEKAARLQAEINKSPVYFYTFNYRGDHSASEYFSQTTNDYGVAHADDLLYVASADPTWFSKYMQSEGDKKLSKIMVDMWTSFAHTGKPKIPGTKWKTVPKKSSDQFVYLDISGPDNLTIKKIDELGQRSFWESLPIIENDKIVVVKDEL